MLRIGYVFCVLVAGFFITNSLRAAELPGQNTKYCDLDTNPIVRGGDQDHLLGFYDGKWEGKLSHTAILSEFRDGNLHGYYVYDRYSPWGINQPACIPFVAEVYDNKVTLEPLPNGAKVTYILEGDILTGYYRRQGRTTRGKFTRVPE